MPSARTSQQRTSASATGTGADAPDAPSVTAEAPHVYRPSSYQPEPLVPAVDHPLGWPEWKQLEANHIALGQAYQLRTVGTTFLTGKPRKHYQVELGTGTRGQTLLYRPDVIMHAGWDDTKWILLEDKYQKKGGSCEAKAFEVYSNLDLATKRDHRVVGAYLVLDGNGWSDKNIERLRLRMIDSPNPRVRVFFSDVEFLAHGITEAWNADAVAAAPDSR